MRKYLFIVLAAPVFLVSQNFTEALVKSIPGQFETTKQSNGNYQVDYEKGSINMMFTFPGEPQVNKDRITFVSTAPIVQLSFLTLPHGDVAASDQADLILSTITDEYKKIGLEISKVTRKNPTKEKLGGKEAMSSSFIIELTNGMSEHITIKVATVDRVDLIPFTRVILSPGESSEARARGDAAAKNFFNMIQIK